jgi:hypothetical protein
MRHEDLNKVAIYEYSKLVLEELEKIRAEIEQSEPAAKDGMSVKIAKKTGRHLDRKIGFLRRVRRDYDLGNMTNKSASKLLKRFTEALGEKDVPAEFDRELAKSIRNNQADWVIKVVDGRGGKGIWVGAKVSEEEFRRGMKAVQAEPGRYKYQRYTALSAISNSIVDVRIHSDLPPKGSLFVSDTAWGRGLSVLGDGKVNLSSQGRETTVIVRSAQKFCESMFVPTQLPSSMVYQRKSR